MSGRFYTLGNFPPENAWGVYWTGTCPDIAGRFVLEHHYSQYPQSPELFELLLRVRETFEELNIRPHPGITYPTLEEIHNWEETGMDSWQSRAGK